MKEILIKIGIILIVVFSFDRIIAFYLDKQYEKNTNIYCQGALNIYINQIKYDTLFMGSSRMGCHIDPRKLSISNYNLSEPSMHIYFFAGVVDILDEYKKLPNKTLVLHIEPFALLESVKNQFTKEINELRYYYHKSAFIKTEIDKQNYFEFIKYKSSLYKHNGRISKLVFGPYQTTNVKISNKGFYPLNNQNNPVVLIDRPSSNLKNQKCDSSLFEQSILHINKIAKKNNINLICITSPVKNPNKNYPLLSKKIAKILKKHSIAYIDYSKNIPLQKSLKNYWHDKIHLNEKGAELFTEIVRNDIKSL